VRAVHDRVVLMGRGGDHQIPAFVDDHAHPDPKRVVAAAANCSLNFRVIAEGTSSRLRKRASGLTPFFAGRARSRRGWFQGRHRFADGRAHRLGTEESRQPAHRVILSKLGRLLDGR